jgi:dienelactone hydrolase
MFCSERVTSSSVTGPPTASKLGAQEQEAMGGRLARERRVSTGLIVLVALGCGCSDSGSPGPEAAIYRDSALRDSRGRDATDRPASREAGAREGGAGSLPEDPGPYPVGTLDDTYTAGSWGTYVLTLYYPAKSAGANAPFETKGAPFPAVVFAHGLGGNKSANTWVGRQLASHGLLCLLLGVPTPNNANVAQWTDGIVGAIDYLVARAAPGEKLAGLLDSARIGATGHSMGANGTILATAKDSRIKAAVPLAYCDVPLVAASIKVPVQAQGASLDGICAPALSGGLYAAIGRPKLHLEMAGGNHIGWLDGGLVYLAAQALVAQGLLPDKPATMPRDEQERLARRYLTSWFGYYLQSDSSYQPFLFGAPAASDLASGKLSVLESTP